MSRIRIAAAAVATTTALLCALPSGASATTSTFNCTGSSTSFTVPSGISKLWFDVQGAGGGWGGSGEAAWWGTNNGGRGGDGARYTGALTVTAGQVITVKVGCKGGHGADKADGGNGGSGGWGVYTGGTGGRSGGTSCGFLCSKDKTGSGGGGGGASGIALGSIYVVAGGGGGGGGGAYNSTGNAAYAAVQGAALANGSSGSNAGAGNGGGGASGGGGGSGASAGSGDRGGNGGQNGRSAVPTSADLASVTFSSSGGANVETNGSIALSYIATGLSLTSPPTDTRYSASESIAFTGDSGASFSCSIDGGSYSSCTSPKSVTGLAVGDHTFSVKQTVGGLTSDAVSTSWTVAVPPAPVVTEGLNSWQTTKYVTTTTPSLTIPTVSGGSLSCSLDNVTFSSCSSPYSFSAPLTNGNTRTLYVKQTTSSGTSSVTTVTFVVDTTVPSTPGFSGAWTGSLPTYSKSTDVTPSVSNKAPDFALFKCSLDGGAWTDCGDSGTITGVSEGDHTLALKQVDRAGNVSSASTARAFTVDLTAPAAPTWVTEAPAYVGPNNNPFPLAWTGALEDGGSWYCDAERPSFWGNYSTAYIDLRGAVSPQPGPCRLNSSGKFTSAATNRLFPGGRPDSWTRGEDWALADYHYYTVRQKDPAGNLSAPIETRWIWDSTAPTLSVAGTAGSKSLVFDYSPASSGTSITRSATVTISSDEPATFKCKLDTGNYETCTSPYSLSGLTDGNHTLSVIATDRAGNTTDFTTTKTAKWTVKATPPAAPTITNWQASTGNNDTPDRGSAYFAFTRDQEYPYDFETQCSMDDSAWAACPLGGVGLKDRSATYNVGLGSALALGTHTFRVRQLNAGGLASEPAVQTFTLARPAAPTITSKPDATISTTTASFAFTAPANTQYLECYLDGATAPGSCFTTYQWSKLSEGTHTFSVRAASAGMQLKGEFAVATFTVETPKPATPSVRLYNDSGGTDKFNHDGIRIFGSRTGGGALVEGSQGGTYLECRLDTVNGSAVTEGSWAECGYPGSLSSSYSGARAPSAVGASSAGAADGTYKLSARAVNQAGKRSDVATTDTFIVDNTRPAKPTVSGVPTAVWTPMKPPANWDGSELETRPTITLSTPDSYDKVECGMEVNSDNRADNNIGDPGAYGPVAGSSIQLPVWIDANALGGYDYRGGFTSVGYFCRSVDEAFNISSSEAYFYYQMDTHAPTATSFTVGGANPTSSKSLTFGLRLDRDVSADSLTASDFTINGTSSGWKIKSVTANPATGNSRSFAIALEPESSSTTPTDGTVGLTLAANATSSTAGLSNDEATSDTVTFDGTAPSLFGMAGPSHIQGWKSDEQFGGMAHLDFDIKFAEAVTGLEPSDFELTGDCASSWKIYNNEITGSGDSYTVTIRPHAGVCSGTVGLRLKANSTVDSAFNTGPASPVTTALIDHDTIGPAAPVLTARPGAVTTANSAEIAFTGTEPGETFRCRIDSATEWTACSSPLNLSGLSAGSHAVSVQGVDEVGNEGGASTVTWTVDAGVTPGTPTLTGTPDGVTAEQSAAISFGPAASGSHFECSADGSAWETCTSPAIFPGLEDGEHSLSVREVTPSGITGLSSVARWTVDTSFPSLPTLSDPPANGTTSRSAAFTITGTPGNTIQCRMDNDEWQTCDANHSVASLGTGYHSFEARQVAPNGRASAASSATWIIGTPPAAPAPTVDPAPTSPTKFTTASFAIVTLEGSSAECSLDNGAWTSCDNVFSASDLSEGEHNLRVRQVDGNDVASEIAARTWKVDNTGPSEPGILGGPGETSTSRDQSFQVRSPWDETGATLECKLDNGAWEPCEDERVNSNSQVSYSNLSMDTHTFSARAIDSLGNVGAVATYTWEVVGQYVAPGTITGGPTGTNGDSSATVSFTVDTGLSAQCSIDGSPWVNCVSPWTSAVGDGPHTFKMRAIDADGNRSASVTRSWTADLTAPAAPTVSVTDASTASTSMAVTFTGESGAAFTCSIDGGPYTACTSPKNYSDLEGGSHTVSVKATDAYGNTSSAGTATWVVRQPSPPVLKTFPGAKTRVTDEWITWEIADSPQNFQCSLDGAAWADCDPSQPRWQSLHLTGLSLGDHTFKVRGQLGGAGAWSQPTTLNWTIVNTSTIGAPTITPSPAWGNPTQSGLKWINTDSPVFTVSAPSAVSYECTDFVGRGSDTPTRLASLAWRPCTDQELKPTGLSQSIHNLLVRGVDSNGVRGEATEVAYRVDTSIQAPAWIVKPARSNKVDYDLADLLRYTGETDQSFKAYQCKVNGSATWGSCRINQANYPNIGTYRTNGATTTVVARQVDQAGNVSGPSETYSWIHDNVAPIKPSWISRPTGNTTSTSATISFRVPTAPSGQYYTTLCWKDTGWMPCSSPFTWNDLSGGRHVFAVLVMDDAGNESEQIVTEWNVSRPSVSNVAITPDSDPVGVHTELEATGGALTGEAGASAGRVIWERCTIAETPVCTAVSSKDATQRKYYLVEADMGYKMRATVTWKTLGGVTTSKTSGFSGIVVPTAAASEFIFQTGQTGPVRGRTMGMKAGRIEGFNGLPDKGVQWQRCTGTTADTCTNITGALGLRYIPALADVGNRLRAVWSLTAPTSGALKGYQIKSATPLSSVVAAK